MAINSSDTPKETAVDISVVVPLLNEDQSLRELEKRIREALEQDYSYEVIFVDDGSTDDSWTVIGELGGERNNVHGIRFRRNYGKSTALQKGFEKAQGRYVVTMDADLQDDPDEVPQMVAMLREGRDLVSGWKKRRHDPLSKTIPSRFFNYVTRLVTGIQLHDFNCGLKAYRCEVVERIQLYGELHRYIPLLAKWEGYSRIGEKEVKHHPRKYGKTKFGMSRFIKGFLDLLTLIFVSRYHYRPMHFFGTLGLLFLIVGGGINLYLTYLKLFHHQALSDRPLLFLGILLIMLGVQFFSIGFLGELINKNRYRARGPNVVERV